MGYSYLMDVHGILFSQQFGAPTYGNSAGLQSPWTIDTSTVVDHSSTSRKSRFYLGKL